MCLQARCSPRGLQQIMLSKGAGEVTHGVPTLGELAEADEEEDAAAEAVGCPAAGAASFGAGRLQQRTSMLGTPGSALAARTGASARLRMNAQKGFALLSCNAKEERSTEMRQRLDVTKQLGPALAAWTSFLFLGLPAAGGLECHVCGPHGTCAC